MQALPSAFLPARFRARRASSCPRTGWRSRRSVVVPPMAAARVPVSKSSADVVPPKGMSRWVCTSMPPGSTSRPVASTTVWPAAGMPGRDFADRLAFNEDVGRVSSVRGDDRAVLDQGAHIAFVLLRACVTRSACSNFRGALRPGLAAASPLSTSLHGDAVIDRADQRAEIAADAFRFVDARNALQRRRIVPCARHRRHPVWESA